MNESSVLLAVLVALGLSGAWLGGNPRTPEPAPTQDDGEQPAREQPAPSDRESAIALGRAVFFDPSLSEPAGTSCAGCHDAAHGFAGNNGSLLGIAQGSRRGHFAKRNTPSVLYLGLVRPFHFHWEEDAPLPEAFGGFFWDGRVDSLAELFRQPLLNLDEMGNPDVAHVAAKLGGAAYASELRRDVTSDSPDALVDAAGKAVEAFLLSDAMSPFTSRYDDYIRGRVAFTPEEARGLALFKDDAKGGCSGCHKLADNSPDPRRSPFSDYGFEVVAPPRNRRLPANADARRPDLGLCERASHDGHTTDARWCGAFRTPSLRNVAIRPAFMHDGAFTKLRDVVAFYATRATNPERWYAGGVFDDLPARYRENVNDRVAPYNRRPGDAPALAEDEIDAIVAFLGALTDAQFR